MRKSKIHPNIINAMNNMAPEKRSAIEKDAIARGQDPETKVRHVATREILDKEIKETGGIATSIGFIPVKINKNKE